MTQGSPGLEGGAGGAAGQSRGGGHQHNLRRKPAKSSVGEERFYVGMLGCLYTKVQPPLFHVLLLSSPHNNLRARCCLLFIIVLDGVDRLSIGMAYTPANPNTLLP